MGTRGLSTVTAGNGNIWRLALLAGTALAINWVAPASAQSAPPEGVTEQRITIPPGSLTSALNSLAAQTGMQILFDAGLANGKTTRGVSGTYSPARALEKLLAGTGVTARFAGDDQVALAPITADAMGYDAGGAIVLDPILVYGARDATTLQDTSASVGIVTAEDIDYGQIQYLPQALRRLANVEKGATNNTGIVVRGVNFEGFSPAGAPMGSIYVDGILQSRYNSRFGARGLWDAEQVEVYRGPQSTLSGRAATAGAIYVKTKDPTFEKELVLSGTVGNKELWGGDFIVNTPLTQTDEIALRVAGSYEQAQTEIDYPSYVNFANYDKFRTELTGNIRAKLLFEPDETPDSRAEFTYSYSKDRPNERLVDPGPGNRGDFYQFSTFAEFREIDVHNVGLEVTHDFSPALILTSQSSVSYGITARESIDNGTPGIDNAFYGTYDDALYSQELRLNYDHGRWTWVAGLFGSYEDQDSVFFARLNEWALEQGQTYKRKTTNLAAFGEAKYEFAPSWKVVVGGRIDQIREQTDEEDTTTLIGYGSSITFNTAKIDEVNAVPKIGISKDFGEDHAAGFTFSQGFRTGGFYVDQQTGEPVYYDPEFANNYEFFYKGLFADQRLRVNANVFYTQYTDQQVETFADPGVPTGTIVNNAASSFAYGFELEPTYDVNENLSVFASIGYVHTEFEEFYHANYGDLAGEAFPEAPEWTVAAGGLYKFYNGFYIGGDAKFLSDYTARFSTNPPLDRIDSRILVNLQAGIRRDRWEINGFVENLFDENYYTMTELDGSPAFAQIGPSRLFGVNVKAKF